VKKPWVLKALAAGKHVVIEKPTALSARDYEEILTAAYAKNKFVIDGTMFPHHPRMRAILNEVSENEVYGSIHRVQAHFTFFADQEWERRDIRASASGDPQGCLGDLGWYCIRFGLMIFEKLGFSPQTAQVVDVSKTNEGVPLDATCVVRFDKVCVCICISILLFSFLSYQISGSCFVVSLWFQNEFSTIL